LEQSSRILEAKDLNARIREAAEAAAREIRSSFAAGASSCTKAFNDALVKGDWERLLDRTAITDAQVDAIKAFLQQAEDLRVEIPPQADEQAELVPDRREAKLKSKRILRFTYSLPDAARLPLALEQTIEWTLRYAGAEAGPGKLWVIAGWDLAEWKEAPTPQDKPQ